MKALILLSASMLIIACTAGGPGDDTTPSPGEPSPTASPTQPATPPVTPEPTATVPATPTAAPTGGQVPEATMVEILAEVAAQAGVDPSQVAVERAQAVTWRDGSLGCPEPGMMYTQALVDGYWVVVRAGAETFDFRMGQTGPPRLCTIPEEDRQPPLEETF